MENIKDIYNTIYKKCPQDGETLYKLIKVMMHNKNISDKGNYAGVHKNILLAGNFGIGKTTMIRECAKAFNLPFHELDASLQYGIDLGFDESFYEIINELRLENRDELLTGVVLIDNLDEVFLSNTQKSLGNYMKNRTMEVSDNNVFLDNIIYVGEFDIGNYLKKSSFNFNVKLSLDKIFSKKKRAAFVNNETLKQYNKMIYSVFNSRDMWNMFAEHIIMPDLDKEAIRKILEDSPMSEYQEFLSQLDIDEFCGFTNKKVVDYVVSSVMNSPLKLNAVSTILNDLYIDGKKHVKKPR